MEDLYKEDHVTDILNDAIKWEEQIVAESAEDNNSMQESMDPKLTTSKSLKEETTESPIDVLPKPSPRYGHAACRYKGLPLLINELKHKNKL